MHLLDQEIAFRGRQEPSEPECTRAPVDVVHLPVPLWALQDDDVIGCIRTLQLRRFRAKAPRCHINALMGVAMNDAEALASVISLPSLPPCRLKPRPLQAAASMHSTMACNSTAASGCSLLSPAPQT